MTYFLAVVAGIPEDQAKVIATAAQYIDDNDKTRPLTDSILDYPYITPSAWDNYHFTLDYNDINKFHGDNTFSILERYKAPSSNQLGKLLSAATNHNNTLCQKSQLYGEFLHALEDSYAHRDRNNKPYDRLNISENSPAGIFGHGKAGEKPDRTYNQYNVSRAYDPTAIPGNYRFYVDEWAYNEIRTLEMEKEVFTKMSMLSGYNYGEWIFNWEDIAMDGTSRTGLPNTYSTTIDDAGYVVTGYKEAKGQTGVLQRFNSYNENAGGNTKEGKIEILNVWLTQNGFNKIPIYDKGYGKYNRNKYLKDLSQDMYPGVILP
jgi:hypothetical protein